jgi:hypothetical protein
LCIAPGKLLNMKKDYQIRNHKELSKKLNALKISLSEKEKSILLDGKAYFSNTTKRLYGRFTKPKELIKLPETVHHLLNGQSLSFILPLLAKNTLFRRSGWITRTLAGLIAQKIGKQLTKLS